jgi:hypothetical protein
LSLLSRQDSVAFLKKEYSIYSNKLFAWLNPGEKGMLENSLSKRRAPRTKVDIEGFYNYNDRWDPCMIYDLSVMGAGMKLNQFFVPGDIIKLKIGLKENFRVIEAIVANVDGQRIGIRFEVDPVMRDFIQEVMNHYNKNKYSPKRRFAVE